MCAYEFGLVVVSVLAGLNVDSTAGGFVQEGRI